jgi:hypothetical protein
VTDGDKVLNDWAETADLRKMWMVQVAPDHSMSEAVRSLFGYVNALPTTEFGTFELALLDEDTGWITAQFIRKGPGEDGARFLFAIHSYMLECISHDLRNWDKIEQLVKDRNIDQ